MFNSIVTILQRNVVDLGDWWHSVSPTYRGAGCLLLALFLMWEATRTSEDRRDRRFFLTGMAALGLLAYGAIVFINGDTGSR
jgi:hypothetical protein